MTSVYILRTDDRPRVSWKISDGHISATDHPIHFAFGSSVGLLRSADQMALRPVVAGRRL